MGSFFAGVKAGTLAGTAYVGGLAAFNVLLLYAFRPEVLALITESYPTACAPTAGPNATAIAVGDCFSSVVAVYVPFVAFIGFFIAIAYSGVFGIAYEAFPGKSPSVKGMVLAVLVGGTLLVLNLVGVEFDPVARVAVTSFFLVWTFVYGTLMGRLYKRYTREVRFVSKGEGPLKIMVDGRDRTGRTRTFALRSSHEVRAVAGGKEAFKGWSVSGGVKVEDPSSYETTMDVEGDGVLVAQSAARS
jgi:hypothetical protein